MSDIFLIIQLVIVFIIYKKNVFIQIKYKMSLIALYYVCSVGIYYIVYRFKIKRNHTQLSKERNCKAYRKVVLTTNGA
jgi:hypothetical protein